MIYIVGVTHDFQCYMENVGETEFFQEIKEFCTSHNIAAIFEEYSEDAVELNGCDDSVCRVIAEHLEIEHEFCDLSAEERERLGILPPYEIKFLDPDNAEDRLKQQNQIRENYWIDIIKSSEFDPNEENILFVCGRDHVESMSDLFADQEFESCFIEEYITQPICLE